MSELFANLAAVAKHTPELLDPAEVRSAMLRAAELHAWVTARRTLTIHRGDDGVERVVLVLDVPAGSTEELIAAGLL